MACARSGNRSTTYRTLSDMDAPAGSRVKAGMEGQRVRVFRPGASHQPLNLTGLRRAPGRIEPALSKGEVCLSMNTPVKLATVNIDTVTGRMYYRVKLRQAFERDSCLNWHV